MKPSQQTAVKISSSGACKSLVEFLTNEYACSHLEVKNTFPPTTNSKGGIKRAIC